MGSPQNLSFVDLISVFFLRPLLAVVFVLSLILLSWYVAWKAVLMHVPLVQEVFGLRKKQVRPKPPDRHRISRLYNSLNPRTDTTKELQEFANSQQIYDH